MKHRSGFFNRLNAATLVALLAAPACAARESLVDGGATARIQRVRGVVTRVALDQRGRAIVDGKFFLNTGEDSEFLTRILPNGETDLSFVLNTRRLIPATMVAPNVLGLETDLDGRVLAAVGGLNQEGSEVPGEIFRLEDSGRIDPLFSTRGQFSTGDAIFAIRALPGHQILVAGQFQTGGDNMGAHVLRLQPNGDIDPIYESAKSTLETSGLAARVIEPAGKGSYYIGKAPYQSLTRAEGNDEPRLTLVNPSGREDVAFGRRAEPHVKQGVYAVRRLKDGRLLVGGIATLTRLQASGLPDSSFRPPKLRSSLPQKPFVVNTVLPLKDGKMLIGGDFITPSGSHGLARLLADGTIDALFEKNLGPGFAADGDIKRGVMGVEVQADGKIIVVGSYLSLDGRTQRTLTRLNPDGTLDDYPAVAETGLR